MKAVWTHFYKRAYEVMDIKKSAKLPKSKRGFRFAKTNLQK